MLIHPVVIVEVGRDVGALQLRAVRLIQRPAFAALAAVSLAARSGPCTCARSKLARWLLAASAVQTTPLRVDVDAARIEAGLGHVEHFGMQRLGRIVASIDAHQIARDSVR